VHHLHGRNWCHRSVPSWLLIWLQLQCLFLMEKKKLCSWEVAQRARSCILKGIFRHRYSKPTVLPQVFDWDLERGRDWYLITIKVSNRFGNGPNLFRIALFNAFFPHHTIMKPRYIWSKHC
jgi:hypothetical protein